MATQNDNRTLGPIELRIRWEIDPEPYDWGNIDPTPDEVRQLENDGVFLLILETRAPACGCCGRTGWEIAEALGSIVGDDAYCRELERELMAEVAA